MLDGRTRWFADWLRASPDSPPAWFADWLAAWLTDRVPGSKAFPHVPLPRRISAGERSLSSPFAVFTVWNPAVGVQPCFVSALGPETPLLRPPLISNRDFLSLLSRLSLFSFLYAHRHAGWGHFERVNRCRLICLGLSDIARVMYLMWSLFSSNKRIKN